MNKRGMFFVMVATSWVVRSIEAQETVIVREGNPVATILISDKDEVGPGIRYRESRVSEAADELAQTIQKISGAKLPIQQVQRENLDDVLAEIRGQGNTPILLGTLGEAGGGDMPRKWSDPNAFLLTVTSDKIAIAGASPRGTEIGVYELLEQLGMRWFFPGEWGTVTPQQKTLAVKHQNIEQRPSFEARHFGMNAMDADPVISDWKKHQREGGAFLPPAHGIRLGDGVTPESHPQYYAKSKHPNHIPQICLSHPEVLPRAIEATRKYFRDNPDTPWIGMGPADGSGFCECDGCLALDGGNWDPFSNERSVTDRYVWFFNEILKGISDEFPDKKIAFYVYHCYIEPPVKVKPDPRIVAAIAPIGLCRVHGMNNPICPERGYLKSIISSWTQILPEVYERGYWFNLADPGMLFIQTHRVRDEIPYYAKQGIKGFRTECTNQWAAHGPSLYLAGRLMWNAEANADDVMKDFCEKFFGPAAQTMGEYFNYLDSQLRDGDHHAGSAFNLLQFYPPDVRQKAESYLREAEKLVSSDELYRSRVGIFASSFAYNESFCRMIEARNEQNWSAAHEALQQMDELRGKLTQTQPPQLSPRQTESYLRRFFRLPIEQGFKRSTNGNLSVAPLHDKWLTLTDPQQVGEKLHYENPEITGGNWQTASTYSTTWTDLGMRYYKGLVWYRQIVDIPKKYVGQKLFLWFGGVDESARVWVNGQLVGTSPSSAFTPFEVDVTDAVRAGDNVVVLCVANLRTDELGTGGITAPAFIYAPKGGKDAVLENVKPLRATFP